MRKGSRQCFIEFALALEANEDRMGESAAMAVTCEQYGISPEEATDWLLMLPDGPWLLEDNRLTVEEREKLRIEYEARVKVD